MNDPIICERYVLPSTDGLSGWAIIHIDSAGFFATVSDFGNYAYNWSHTGRPLKEFLISLAKDPDYLCKKLWSGRELEFDADATRQLIREYILSYRKSGDFTREQARVEWKLASIILDEESFRDWHDGTSFCDAAEFAVYDPSPECLAFCKEVYPRFVELLRAETEASEVRQRYLCAPSRDAESWFLVGSVDSARDLAESEEWSELWVADPKPTAPGKFMPSVKGILDNFEDNVSDELRNEDPAYDWPKAAEEELQTLLADWANRNCKQVYFTVSNQRQVVDYVAPEAAQ